MAVASGWVGSSAKAETGKEWMSAAATELRITARPFYMSAMVGKSKEISQALTVTANTAYTNATLINAANALANKDITNLTITVTGTIISNTTSAPCLNFAAAPFNSFKSVHLVINSGVRVSGRGGNGGSTSAIAATAGGVGITNSIGTKLRITNNGYISGGGGGGGSVNAYSTDPDNYSSDWVGGGGGCPLGAAGSGDIAGKAATATAAGAGGTSSYGYGGAGGGFGAAGSKGSSRSGGGVGTYNAGAAGAAVNGSAPTWVTLGTINGSRV